jgi:hypothetical protein
MTVGVQSNDGKAHSVQVYSDISGEWVSGDTSLTATWSTDTATNGLITHKVQLQTQQTYTEHNDHIQRELHVEKPYSRLLKSSIIEGSAYYSMTGVRTISIAFYLGLLYHGYHRALASLGKPVKISFFAASSLITANWQIPRIQTSGLLATIGLYSLFLRIC